jgi:lysophospholipid acyltransferase (LPLAT)-like uncharacterized protein
MVYTQGTWNANITAAVPAIDEYLENVSPDGQLIDRIVMEDTNTVIRSWTNREAAQAFIDFMKQFPQSQGLTIIEDNADL